MQCPTCGTNTPGTLGKCSNCDAPIDVYSVGPLPAPVQNAPADPLGEKTMMVPPPTPAWASANPAPGDPESTATWTFDPDAEGYTPNGGMAALPPASGGSGAGAGAGMGAGAGANGGTSGYSVPPPMWTGEQQPPNGQPPMNGQGQGQPALGAAPASELPALPAAGGYGGGPLAPDAPPTPVESIVPDSWFAQPRKPGPHDSAESTQVYAPQQPADQGWGAPLHPAGSPPQDNATMLDGGATQLAPGPMGAPLDGRTRMDLGPGGMDHTRMDGGGTSVMGAPQMGPGGFGGDGYGGGGGYGGPMGQGMPMGQGGPVHPGYQQVPAPSGGGGPGKGLLIGVGVLVAAALVAVVFVVWPSGGKGDEASPQTSKSATKPVSQNEKVSSEEKQQAQAMSSVLDASVDARRVLAGALSRAGKCKDLPAAIPQFQQAVQRRQNQLNRTRSLKVDKLRNGPKLRSSLADALQASLHVDQLLLNWAQQSRAHCHGKPKPNAAHVPGRAVGERRATQTKQRFVTLWNPVARKTGQPVRSWSRV